MNALVYKASGEPIGRFEIECVEDLPEKLQAFVASGVRTPLHSYVEASGEAWTIIGFNPIKLREGRLAAGPAQEQRRRTGSRHSERRSGDRGSNRAHREYARRQMTFGLCWCVGGLFVTGISYASAVSTPGGSHYILAWGAIIFGGFRFLRGFVALNNK